MTLGAALNAAVSGLQAQSAQVSAVSENIANASTTAYKIRDITFQSLVVGDTTGSASQSVAGGVLFAARQNITEQGLIQNTGVTTNIAINGGGFFITAEESTAQPAELVYTRNGDFRTDENGLLVNNEGQILFGQRTDEDGTVTAANNTSLNSLEPVDVSTISSTTQTTTNVEFDINLPADNPAPAILEIAANAGNAAVLGTSATSPVTSDPAGGIFNTFFDSPASSEDFVYEGIVTVGGANATATTLLGDLDIAATNLSFGGAGSGDAFILDVTTNRLQTATQINIAEDGVNTLQDLINAIEAVGNLRAEIETNAAGENVFRIYADNSNSSPFTTAFEVIDEQGNSFTVQQTFERVGVDEYRVTYDDPIATADLNDDTIADADKRRARIDIDPSTPADYVNGTDIENVQIFTFNTDGSIASIGNVTPLGIVNSSAAPVAVEFGGFREAVPIASGSDAFSVNLDYGTAGLFDGLTLFSSNSSVPEIEIQNIDQDGVRFGSLAGVEIDRDGIVTALFDNGVRRPIFQIPIATFPNPAGLTNVEGTIYDENENAGNLNLLRPGQGNAGTIQPTSIENSTTDTSEEFNKLIVSQQAYSSAAQVVSTADDLFDTLIRSVQ